jgi:hypothetical protein
MDSQQHTNGLSDRPSFFEKMFGQPPVWRLIPQAGPRYWAGVLTGVGLGLMAASILVDLELLTSHYWRIWAIVPGIALMLVGQERLRVVVRRQEKGDQGQTGQS